MDTTPSDPKDLAEPQQKVQEPDELSAVLADRIRRSREIMAELDERLAASYEADARPGRDRRRRPRTDSVVRIRHPR